MSVDDDRRALSDHLERVLWPPRVGERIHSNSGWARTSWTGEVRALVDVDGRSGVAVIWRTVPAYGKSRWATLEWSEVHVFKLRYGPLPKELTRIPPGEDRCPRVFPANSPKRSPSLLAQGRQVPATHIWTHEKYTVPFCDAHLTTFRRFAGKVHPTQPETP